LAKTIQTQAIQTIPEGQETVGSGIARDFGKDMGVFKGKVMHVQAVRRRDIYHVEYEDGDSEDFDLDEYRYAYEMRQALDKGVEYVPDGLVVAAEQNDSADEASETGTPKPKKRARQARNNKNSSEACSKRRRGKKVVKEMDKKTYTLVSVLNEFDAETEYGKALRAMPESDRKIAVMELKEQWRPKSYPPNILQFACRN
jgi:hypothetical protein